MPHHARLFVSHLPKSVIETIVTTEESTSEIITFASDTVSIDEVRQVIQLAFQTPGNKSYRLIVLQARQIAHEAQHALLKILEEPPLTTRFVIILPSLAGLLPTIVSRVAIVSEHAETYDNPVFTRFITTDAKSRLEMIADIVKRKADEDYSELYDGLVSHVSTGDVAHDMKSVVQTALIQLRQKGASKKMVWEELALTLPVVQ